MSDASPRERPARFARNRTTSRPVSHPNVRESNYNIPFRRAGVFFRFFFQAEDGIRDDLVTGVQTCALPISSATVFVKELERQDLQGSMVSIARDSKNEPEAEVLLLESSQAPRPQVADFLQKNGDVELVNLSEASDPFSTLVNLGHPKIEGSKILLEYSSNSNFEDLVKKFFDEGIANAEMCTLFTSKSSKLYRALKGKRMVRIIAASSLVSAPDELPDGEIQIPDKELGLVTSLVTDLFENNKSVALSFVFDSITELIRGERWEQVYSGIKQLIELLNPSTVTAIFLVSEETTEERFLGALRGLFSVQMRLDDTENQGLRVVKAEF